MPTEGVLPQLFLSEPAGRFALGHVFSGGKDLVEPTSSNEGIGHWRCDIADDNKLTWSNEVYELFGIPAGTQIDRDDAVAHYSEQSKSVLERLRAFAINRRCGFILDALISADGGNNQWIRLIAFPILNAGRVVGLQGLKRAL